MRLEFAPNDEDFQYDDVIWATKDMVEGKSHHMLVVEELDLDGHLICRDINRGFLKDFRKFEENEVFTLVATYRDET